MSPEALFESRIPSLELLARGKVRDVYAIDDRLLLIVATDRLSAYDVVLPDPVPGKGVLLTAISNFWFESTSHIAANHLSGVPLESLIRDSRIRRPLEGRAVIVQRLRPLPIEAVVRGYLIGSGWRDYCRTGSVCGIELPDGLQQAERLRTPVFTPATKAAVGEHDENISFEQAVEIVGEDLAVRVRDLSLKIYDHAVQYAAHRGIIIADTKFEFGLNEQGDLFVIDEMLTPDSSRFWPADAYRIGTSPPSYDKQYVRDYLDTLDWDKTAPGPTLPTEVLAGTAARYKEAFTRLAGPATAR